MFVYLFQYKRTYNSDYTWVNVPEKLQQKDLESITEIIPRVLNRKISSIHIKDVTNGIIMCTYQESNQIDEYGRQTYEVQGIFIDTTEGLLKAIKYYILEYFIICYYDYSRNIFNDSSNVQFLSLDWIQNVIINSKHDFLHDIRDFQYLDCFVDSNYVIKQNPFLGDSSFLKNPKGNNINNDENNKNNSSSNSYEETKGTVKGGEYKLKQKIRFLNKKSKKGKIKN